MEMRDQLGHQVLLAWRDIQAERGSLVFLEQKDQRVSQETQEELGRSVNRVLQGLLVLWGSQEFRVRRVIVAALGLQVHQEKRDQWVILAIQGLQVLQVLLGLRVCLVHVGLQVYGGQKAEGVPEALMDQQEDLGSQVPRDLLVYKAKKGWLVNRAKWEKEELLAHEALQEFQDHLAPLGKKEFQGTQGHLDLKDLLGQWEKLDIRDLQVKRENQDHQVNQG